MFLLVLVIASTLSGQLTAQQAPSRCVAFFDQGFRQCFRDSGGFELDIVFSLVTNETSGRLPPNLAPQKANLVKSVCSNRQKVTQCITPLVSNADASCQQTDIGMMDGTVNSMVSGLGNLCGTPTAPSACLQNFDTGFRSCLTSASLNPDNFFKLLSNQTLPNGINKAQLKQSACSDTTRQNLLKCATTIVAKLQTDCKPQEQIMVGTTLQNMMGAYEGVCTGKSINPDQCMAKFETGMNTCATKTLNMDMNLILMVLNNQTLPAGQNAASLKKKICGQWKNLENCGKDVVIKSDCARTNMLMVEASFANMMITTATYCGDTSLPGACLLTIQKQFGQCFGKVGLNPAIYMGNDTKHRGALIGATQQEAEVYCEKKHDLFTCMQEVMHGCPGAEQTLSLTGFDIHGMERAVGLLCHDIPHYLGGLDCFSTPTDKAKQCMQDMTTAITELSTKQITQRLSMDSFFADFCTSRVNHVSCDAAAWDSCDMKAIELKNQFECQLIPSRCYNSHKDNIDNVCPSTEVYIPTDTKIHVHEQPACARNIHQSMNQCFQKYGLEPDMFLVNITHDRSNFLGNGARARSLCGSKAQVFSCMRGVLDGCPAASDVLAFWGHQQSSLEGAVNVICNDLAVYGKGVQCFGRGNSVIQQCIANTQSKMLNLADKQVTKNLSPDAYFRDFCSIRMEQLRCDLNGWKGSCEADVIGLKTEFECTLIQGHCKNLQVGNYKTLCNPTAFAQSTRQSGQAGGAGGDDSPGAASAVSASIVTVLGVIASTFMLVVL